MAILLQGATPFHTDGMKIGIIAEPYEESHASGMGYVVMEFMRHLLQMGSEHEFVIYSSKEISRDVVRGTYTTKKVPSSMLGRYRYFKHLKDDIDALVFVVPLSPLVLPRHIKAVALCQEIAPLKLPRRLTKDALLSFVRDFILMPRLLKHAAVVISPSVSTQEMLKEEYGVSQEKMVLIYNGFQNLAEQGVEPAPLNETLKPFFFFAGKVKPRKNVHGIMNGFVEMCERIDTNAQLVIAGDYGGEYYANLIKTAEEHGLRDRVHFVGYAGPSELLWYYSNATALVFPSFSEGFGMPIIEAMSLGLPVITADMTATGEVAGGAALLVDPNSSNEISRAMERVLTDPKTREECVKRGYERAKDFSWVTGTGRLLEVLKSL